MLRILVTGGAGFIGSHLVEALVARGDEAIVLDNFDDAYDPALKESHLRGVDARVVRGDIRDVDLVARLVGEVDQVVHMAARAGVRQSLADPLLYQDVNLRGTTVILDALRKSPGVPLVFASSSSVYGASRAGPFREDRPADLPASPYAATKRSGELLCHAAWAGWGVPTTCLRFFTVYGPRQRPAMAIARFVRRVLGGRPVPMFGDGSSARDYTWVHDAVSAVLASLQRVEGYSVINIGSASPIRLDDLVAAIGHACGRDVAIERLPDQPGDVPLTFADNSLARERLGWTPTTTIEEGLARYLDHVRS